MAGQLTERHKFMLRVFCKGLDITIQKIAAIDKQIDKLTKTFAKELALLQTIPSVNKFGSVCILSEVGSDMSKFPTVQHLASWAGICPGNNESEGRQKST